MLLVLYSAYYMGVILKQAFDNFSANLKRWSELVAQKKQERLEKGQNETGRNNEREKDNDDDDDEEVDERDGEEKKDANKSDQSLENLSDVSSTSSSSDKKNNVIEKMKHEAVQDLIFSSDDE